MSDTLIVLFYLFGVGFGSGAFFWSYKIVADTSHRNLQNSYQLYERSDIWRKSNFHGSQKQP